MFDPVRHPLTDRRVDRDTVDHADAVTGASKNASDVFMCGVDELWGS